MFVALKMMLLGGDFIISDFREALMCQVSVSVGTSTREDKREILQAC